LLAAIFQIIVEPIVASLYTDFRSGLALWGAEHSDSESCLFSFKDLDSLPKKQYKRIVFPVIISFTPFFQADRISVNILFLSQNGNHGL